MTEKHVINNRDVWITVEALPAHRQNPAVIPTEYFTASWFLQEPSGDAKGQMITEDGEDKLFESPVAALSHARKVLETELPA